MYWLALVIVIILFIILFSFLAFRRKDYGNSVLNLLQNYRSWKIDSDLSPNEQSVATGPYSFEVSDDGKGILITFYYYTGYFNKIVQYHSTCALVDANSIHLNLQDINPNRPVPANWTLTYINDASLRLSYENKTFILGRL